MRSKALVSILGCVVLVSAQAIQPEEEIWKNCSTSTTHYVLQVPGSLVPASEPGVTGCMYHSQDGEFNVEAVEQADNQPLGARMQREIELLQGSVTDQKKGDNWFALTGVTGDGIEYYRLHYTNGAQWVSLRITYPRAKAKQYDKWVTRIDKEFVPFSNAATNNAAVPKTILAPKTVPTPKTFPTPKVRPTPKSFRLFNKPAPATSPTPR